MTASWWRRQAARRTLAEHSGRLLARDVVKPAPAQSPTLAGLRPNIVLVLTDDQGYGDLSAHGNPVLQTPHLDRLQAESLRFTDFLVSPTCSPTRAALMTGRHEFANGVTHTIYERERLTLAATTIAQMLRAGGYATGIFGKWHLGDEAEYRPDRRGFDEVYIHGGGGIGQTYPGSCGDAPDNSYFDPALLHNGTFEKTEGYCTDLFFRQAFQWIEAQATAEKPFFASIAINAPHAPSVARPEDRTQYEGRGRLNPSQQNFFGMIHNIDENVGRLVNRLDELRIAAVDRWWADVLTRVINEQAVGPQINPFQELYYRQFGGQPTPEALERMRPEREVLSPQRRSPQPKTTPAG